MNFLRKSDRTSLDSWLFGEEKHQEANGKTPSSHIISAKDGKKQNRIRFFNLKKNDSNFTKFRSSSFERLQGHVPYTLEDIIKDPKRLPFLLSFLSDSNHHQVLLFVLELEQHKLVPDEFLMDQAKKIFTKYFSETSELSISRFLSISIDDIKAIKEKLIKKDEFRSAFQHVEHIAFSKLETDDLPKFLKSDEYLDMLMATNQDATFIPMEHILQQPRAAHYFLLFLMQSRQHFELYFWMRVEYMLKPLICESENRQAYSLAHELEEKIHSESEAITLSTKKELHDILQKGSSDGITAVLGPFIKAQKEIFLTLRTTWYPRFAKSNLYKMLLKDASVHLDPVNETISDSSSISNSSSSPCCRMSDIGSAHVSDEEKSLSGTSSENENIKDDDKLVLGISNIEQIELKMMKKEDNDIRITENVKETRDLGSKKLNEIELESTTSSERPSVATADSLDLESIIRMTELPDGLQVHYQPNYLVRESRISDLRNGNGNAVSHVLTFEAHIDTTEKIVDGIRSDSLILPSVSLRFTSCLCHDEICSPFMHQNLENRVRPFLVPDGRFLKPLSREHRKIFSLHDHSTLFPFIQNGSEGAIYAACLQLYKPMQFGLAACGVCIVSEYPLIQTLRNILREYASDMSLEHIFDDSSLRNLLEKSTMDPCLVNCSSPRLSYSSSFDRILPISPSPEHQVDLSLRPLFECLGIPSVLQIIASCLLEHSIVFVSRYYSQLTLFAESIRCLLHPFTWCHVYAPLLPKQMLSYLQCPTPFIIGVNGNYTTWKDLPSKDTLLVVDIDKQVLEGKALQSLAWNDLGLRSLTNSNGLPKKFLNTKEDLEEILHPILIECDSILNDTNINGKKNKKFPERQVRRICSSLVKSLLQHQEKACLVVGDSKESVLVFDEKKFLKEHAEDEHDFLSRLMRTQGFSERISTQNVDTIVSNLYKVQE